MKKYKKIQVLVISLLCLVLVLPVRAGTSGTEQNLTSANDRLTKLQSSRSDLASYMSELDNQLSELSSTLSTLDEQQAQKEVEISQTEAALEAAREREAEQYESMKMRIQYMYENDNLDFLNILFGSENLSDMLNKLDFITQITQYDRDMLISYQETKDTIALKETELSAELEDLAALHEQTVQEQNTISVLLQEASSELKQFDTDIASAEQQISAYEEELLKQEEAIRARMEAAEDNNEKQVADNSDSQKKSSTSENTTSDSTDKTSGNSSNKDNNDKTTGSNGNNTGSTDTDKDDGNSAASYSDLDFLAALIECEAGGESMEGKVAVGSVVMNRVSSSRYPNSVQTVIYQSGQFAPVTSGRFAVVLARGANSSSRTAASRALAGEKPVGSCLYFRTVASAEAAGITPTYTIGNHVFY